MPPPIRPPAVPACATAGARGYRTRGRCRKRAPWASLRTGCGHATGLLLKKPTNPADLRGACLIEGDEIDAAAAERNRQQHVEQAASMHRRQDIRRNLPLLFGAACCGLDHRRES